MNSKYKNYCNQDCNFVIDLTQSFDLAIHHHLINSVIDLDTTDESFSTNNVTNNSDVVNDETLTNGLNPKKRKSTGLKKKNNKSPKTNKSPHQSDIKKKRTSGGLGECPICCDNLGKNPLASTKCGHVYCLKCLEQSLKIAKKCPTCRCVLKGSSAYHPLYLNY